MRIYTRGGDKGETSLLYGRRVKKSDIRVEAYGTVDEANAAVGLAIATLMDEGHDDIRRTLLRIQRDLFDVGRDLATPPDKRDAVFVTADDVTYLERLIDHFDTRLSPLNQFLLPGGALPAAHLHHARTIIRRAERCVVLLASVDALPFVQSYLNRLSDLLFVLARTVNERLCVATSVVDFRAPKPEVDFT